MSTHVTVTHRNKLTPHRVLKPCWAVSTGTTDGWHCPRSLSGSCLCISRGVLFLLSAHGTTTLWQKQVSKPTLLPACLSHFLHQAVAVLPNPRIICRAWVRWGWPEQSCRLWFPFLLLHSAISFMDFWLRQGLLPQLVSGWLKFGQFICCFSPSSQKTPFLDMKSLRHGESTPLHNLSSD